MGQYSSHVSRRCLHGGVAAQFDNCLLQQFEMLQLFRADMAEILDRRSVCVLRRHRFDFLDERFVKPRPLPLESQPFAELIQKNSHAIVTWRRFLGARKLTPAHKGWTWANRQTFLDILGTLRFYVCVVSLRAWNGFFGALDQLRGQIGMQHDSGPVEQPFGGVHCDIFISFARFHFEPPLCDLLL